jgi:hypothetical protein
MTKDADVAALGIKVVMVVQHVVGAGRAEAGSKLNRASATSE